MILEAQGVLKHKMLNIYHISLTNFLFESRVIKEVSTISSMRIFDVIYIIALHKEGLRKVERLGKDAIIVRIQTTVKNSSQLHSFKFLIYIELIFRVFYLLKRSKKAAVSLHVIDLLPLAFLIKIIKGWKVIYDAHELEPHTTSNKRRIYLLTLLENIFIPFVDLIIVVNESIKDIYRRRFPRKDCAAIYNAPYFQNIRNTQIIRGVLKLKLEDKIFLYQGGLVDGRGIVPLLKAFSLLDGTQNVLVFIGYGDLKNTVLEYVNQHSNIFLLDAVPPSQLLEYTSSCDFGVSLIENTCLSYYYCLPNKVLEYLMCKKPIIVSNLFEMKALINQHQVGIVAKDFSADSIILAIESISSMDRNEIEKNIEGITKTYCWEAQEIKLQLAYKRLFNF